MTRAERAIAVLAPFASAAAVGAALRMGAPAGVPAAVVYGARPAASAAAVAWQVFAFRDEQAVRWPMAATPLAISATEGDRTTQWRGDTNADGFAEALLAVTGVGRVRLQVSVGGTILARGNAVVQSPPPGEPRYAAWASFVRRSGRIALDVAVLGQRVAPGFPATLCVRAADAATGAPMAGVEVRADADASLTPIGAGGVTDSAGWAALAAIPVGLAVSLTLHARKLGGFMSPTGLRTPSGEATRTGEWIGGLFVSPGAPRLQTRARWLPGDDPEIELDAPTARPLAYIEIDDRRGRAWAASVPLEARGAAVVPSPSAPGALAPGAPAPGAPAPGAPAPGAPASGAPGAPAPGALAPGALVPGLVAAAASAVIRVPSLPPGLYWAVAAGDPRGGSELGPGTSVRPFFVAASDEDALAFGTDPDACARRRSPEETARALWPCLSVASARPVARWVALDGSASQRDGARRSHGIALAVGAVTVAALLELLLLLRAAARPRARALSVELDVEREPFAGSFPQAEPPAGLSPPTWWTVGIALLVALLGFVLLAAFVVRAS